MKISAKKSCILSKILFAPTAVRFLIFALYKHTKDEKIFYFSNFIISF